jgi:hypothetical protein
VSDWAGRTQEESLHDGADEDLLAVAERVDVDLDRVLDETVDEHRPADRRHRRLQVGLVVAHAHRAAAEDVRRSDEHRVADLAGSVERLVDPLHGRPGRAADAELLRERTEPLPILREVDRRVRRAENPVAGRLDVPREAKRRLAAELRDDTDGLLAVDHGEHLLRRERLEVQPVGGVVVGRDGLRVAVDHDGLVAEAAEGLHRVDAAVVELDALPDPVRARAEDHDARLRPGRRRPLVLLAPGRVEVVRGRVDLAAAGVDTSVGGLDPARVARPPHVVAGGSPGGADRVVPPPRPLGAPDVPGAELALRGLELLDEPRVQAVGQVVDRRPRRRRARVELP